MATYNNGLSTLRVHALAPQASTLFVRDLRTVDPDFEGGTRIESSVTTAGTSHFLNVLSVDASVAVASRGANDGTVHMVLSDNRSVTIAFNLAAQGGTIEIRDPNGAVMTSEPLASTVSAPPLLAAPLPTALGSLATRYRLYHPGTREHLYTTDLNEYNTLPGFGWTPEGSIYRLFSTAGSYGGVAAVPYYRLYNASIFQHHWTADANEYAVLPSHGWTQEGIDGYVLPSPVPGTLPLYRLFHPFGMHLWTTDANERNVLASSAGWIDEGVAAFVLPLP
jgi:hypothetical protein